MQEKSKLTIDDQTLVQNAKAGNQAAFTALMEKYKPIVYRDIYLKVKNSELAEDLTMEAIAKAFTQIDKYQPDYAFSTWLKRVSSNHVIDFVRKKRVDTTSIDQFTETEDGAMQWQIEGDSPSPDIEMERKERHAVVRQYVQKLKEMYRSLIEMRYYDELSYEEIAQLQAIPIGTVKARLHRAKGMLNQMMVPGRNYY